MAVKLAPDTEQNSGEELRLIRAIEKRYSAGGFAARLQNAWQVMQTSFQQVQQHREVLGGAYMEIESYYQDAKTVYFSRQLEAEERETLFYHISNLYFEKIALLPWKKRRAIRADFYIKRMKRSLKQGDVPNTSLQYWVQFLKYCTIPLAIALLGEFAFLNMEDGSPQWQVVLSLAVMLIGLGVYMVLAYELEGRRLHANLQKWIHHRVNPKEQDRPFDALQYIRMGIPLLVAVGSALIKLYIQ